MTEKSVPLSTGATWILDSKRPDLIISWFRELDALIAAIRRKVEERTYGGLPNGCTTADLQDEIRLLREQARFQLALASLTKEEQEKRWSKDTADRVNVEVRSMLDSMEESVRKITKMDAFLQKVCAEVAK